MVDIRWGGGNRVYVDLMEFRGGVGGCVIFIIVAGVRTSSRNVEG